MPGYRLQGGEKRLVRAIPASIDRSYSDSTCPLFLHKKVDRYSLKQHLTFANAREKNVISE